MDDKLSAAQATIGQYMNAIASCFLPGVRVTVLARNPDGEASPGARDFMMTSDTLDEAAAIPLGWAAAQASRGDST